MGKLLARCALVIACTGACAEAFADDLGQRHDWAINFGIGLPSASTSLGPWTSGEFGKLRFDSAKDEFAGNRLTAEYRGHLTKTLWVNAVADYVDDASSGVDLTEAYLDWRPIPESANQHQFRIGAFYPPFSLENGDFGWESPFTTSFSAINTWLGEEIRPLGAEWSLRRQLGYAGSPHRLGTFAGAFYGNDPAGTLLFWRGFSLHDRQTRLNDRLSIPPTPIVIGGVVTGLRPNRVEPFEEIDDEPGYYAGVEWRYARRALFQVAVYDNRADPNEFRDGQWGWRTRFNHVAAQLSLPADFGLISQWMDGATYWLVATTPAGMRTPATRLVRDDFESAFVLLTKRISAAHRVSVRYDRFEFTRGDAFGIDSGDAWTFGYQYRATEQIGIALEWLTIDSARELWTRFYGLPGNATERQMRLHVNFRVKSSGDR
jgi:hypothetical protein